MRATYFQWTNLLVLLTLSYVLAVPPESIKSKPDQTHSDHSQGVKIRPQTRFRRTIIDTDYDQDTEFDHFRKTLRSTLTHIQSQKYNKAPSTHEMECQGTARRLLHTLLGMRSIVPNDKGVIRGEADTPPEVSFDPKLNGTVSNLLLGMTRELTHLASCNPNKVSWAVQLLQPISSALNSQENQFQITSSDIEKILLSQVETAVRTNSDDLEAILLLAQERFTVKQLRHLLEVLFVEKENQNKIRSPDFLMFAHAVGSLSQSYTNQSDRREFDHLNLKIASPTIIILNSWADQIRRRVFASIVNYPKNSQNAEKSFSYFFPKLIQVAYTQGGGVESIETLLEFARSLQTSEFVAAGYSEILKQMEVNKHVDNHYQISLLAWRVKEALSGGGSVGTRQVLGSTKFALPPSIRRLVFDEHKYVIIESAAYPSYTLYASTWRNIYTYPHYNYAGGNNQKWKVYGIENGRYFAFENIQTGKVLAEYGNKQLQTDSMTYSDYKKQWRIFPINNGTHVYFRNRQSGNYLSGGDFQKCGVSSRTGLRTKPNTFVNKYSNNQEWTIIY